MSDERTADPDGADDADADDSLEPGGGPQRVVSEESVDDILASLDETKSESADSSDTTVTTSATSLSFAVGDYIFVTTDPSNTLRRITRAYLISYDGGTTNVSHYHVFPPWGVTPQKDGTVNAQQLNVFVPETVGIWERRVTSI